MQCFGIDIRIFDGFLPTQLSFLLFLANEVAEVLSFVCCTIHTHIDMLLFGSQLSLVYKLKGQCESVFVLEHRLVWLWLMVGGASAVSFPAKLDLPDLFFYVSHH